MNESERAKKNDKLNNAIHAVIAHVVKGSCIEDDEKTFDITQALGILEMAKMDIIARHYQIEDSRLRKEA